MPVDEILESVEVIPATALHMPWIFSTFRCQAQRPASMLGHDEASRLADALMRVMRGPGRAVVAVPRGYDDAPVGWSVGIGASALFAYVREPLRRHGIANALVGCLTPSPPVRLAMWTDEAEAIQRHGYPVEYDIHAFRELCSYVRPASRGKHHNERAA